MLNRNPLKILIAASGTGGHLFPALQIAQAFKTIDPSIEISFVGSGRPLEETILGPTGFRRFTVPTVGLRRRGLKGIVEWIQSLPQALSATRHMFKEYPADIVIGVGGYASVLPTLIGRALGKATWIHEAEKTPGLANYFLSLISHRISTSVRDAKMPRWAKVVHTGHPIRSELFSPSLRKSSLSSPPKLLILGGSQGAKAIDTAVESLALYLSSKKVEVWHQARKDQVASLEVAYAQAGVPSKVVSFIHSMAEAFQWSDIVITRAGAGAISELDAVGRPGIAIPLPGAVEQKDNALTIASRGVVIAIEEGPSLPALIQHHLDELLQPDIYKKKCLLSSHQLPARNAAIDIARGCMELLNR